MERIDIIREHMTLNWTEEQQDKLSKIYSLVYELMFELDSDKDKIDELKAMSMVYVQIEPIISGVCIKQFIGGMKEKGNY